MQGTPWGQQAKELNHGKTNHMWENDLGACLRSGFVSLTLCVMVQPKGMVLTASMHMKDAVNPGSVLGL